MSSNGIEQLWPRHIQEQPAGLFTPDVAGALTPPAIEDMGEAPTPEQTAELLGHVEELCSGHHGTNVNGIYVRQLPHFAERQSGDPLQLSWNVAGTLGGFGVNAVLDSALASIENIPTTARDGRLGHMFPVRPRSTESLYIPHGAESDTLIPIIRKTIWHRSGPTYTDRRARASEVCGLSAVLDTFITHETESHTGERPTKRPTYLEIGFGIDPAVFRGNRRYRTKTYLGIDPGVGAYENPLGEYPEAVRTSAELFAEDAKHTRPDEHIYFVIGDAQNLDLPSKSVREVFMSNVVNAPLDDEVRSNILKETHRVLDATGTLVLRVNWHQDAWPSDAVIGRLQHHEFAVVRSVFHTEPEYSQLEAQYGTPSQVPAPDGYYVIATARQ